VVFFAFFTIIPSLRLCFFLFNAMPPWRVFLPSLPSPSHWSLFLVAAHSIFTPRIVRARVCSCFRPFLVHFSIKCFLPLLTLWGGGPQTSFLVYYEAWVR